MTKEKKAEYWRNWYAKNKKRKMAYSENNRKKHFEWVKSLKIGKSCFCGESDPRCLDFHHRNPNEKCFNISDLRHTRMSKSRVLKELEKCDLICSNCHRKLHVTESYWKNV